VKWLAVAALLAGGAARADVWQQAIDHGSPDAHAIEYDAKLRMGDDLAEQANSHDVSAANVRRLVDLAASSYREAAAAEPSQGEPMYRLGRLLYSFYFECTDQLALRWSMSPLCATTGPFDRKHAEEVIAAWDEFEKRAPLDPRLSVDVGEESEILFKRAILNTRLATKPHLEAAAHDYEKLLARAQTSEIGGSPVLSNLAETYMMLDRLDDAIDMYREAWLRGSQTSTVYGLAVALDRDDRGTQAIDLILSQGVGSVNDFHTSVLRGETFYVPEGEKFYYFALLDEAFGKTAEAVENWRLYINSGAHPEFQPRAKAHIDALSSGKHLHAPPPHLDDAADESW